MTEPQQFLIYQSEDGSTRIDVMLEAETLWLSQKQLTELFGKAKGTISEHIKHIFEDGELDENSVVRFFRTVQPEGGEVARGGGNRRAAFLDLRLVAHAQAAARHFHARAGFAEDGLSLLRLDRSYDDLVKFSEFIFIL